MKHKRINKNVVFIELLGNAAHGVYSLNYERMFYLSHTICITSRIGISYLPEQYNIPCLLNVLIGGKRHHMEAGFGISTQYLKVGARNEKKFIWKNEFGYSYRLGYRYQKPDGKFMLSICYTPTYYLNFNKAPTSYFIPLLFQGLSFGYAFLNLP